MRLRILATIVLGGALAGCGTTKWSDTSRTAMEQMLISDSIERAVSRVDLRAVAGKKVYLDSTPLSGIVDSSYLVSSVKQHVLASGGIIKEKREEADYIVELRAGAIGMDRNDLLFGVPALTVPTVAPLTGVPNQIPEIPFVKRTEQKGVAKISLHIYNAKTGRPLWQSGTVAAESKAKNVWVFGAGPFQRGTIYSGTKFAGNRFSIPLIDFDKDREGENALVSVADEAFFVEPPEAPAKTAVAAGAGSTPAVAAPQSSGSAAATGAAASPVAAPTAPNVVPASHAAPPSSAAPTAATPAAAGGAPSLSSTTSASNPATTAGAATAAASTPPGGPALNQPATGPALNLPPGPSAPLPPDLGGPAKPASSGQAPPVAASRVIRLPPTSPFDDPPPAVAEAPAGEFRR